MGQMGSNCRSRTIISTCGGLYNLAKIVHTLSLWNRSDIDSELWSQEKTIYPSLNPNKLKSDVSSCPFNKRDVHVIIYHSIYETYFWYSWYFYSPIWYTNYKKTSYYLTQQSHTSTNYSHSWHCEVSLPSSRKLDWTKYGHALLPLHLTTI